MRNISHFYKFKKRKISTIKIIHTKFILSCYPNGIIIGGNMRHILMLVVLSVMLQATTLDELVADAIQNSISIQQARSSADLAKLKAKESRASRFGEVDVIGSATHYNIERTLAPMTPSSMTSGKPITTSDDIFSGGLSYSVPLFTGFAQTRQVEIDEIASKMADVKLTLTKEQLIYNIRSLYLAILTQQELLKAQKNYSHALHKLDKQINYEVKLGKKAQIDLLKSKADYQASKTKEAMLKANIKSTKATLSALVGKKVTTIQPISINVVKPNYLLDELYAQSSTLKKLQSDELAIKKAQKLVEKSESANLPQLNLSSYYGKNFGEDIKSDDWDDKEIWQVGVNLKYNLLDFGKSSANRQKAKIAKQQAKLKKEQTMLDLKKLLIEAIAKIEQSYAEYRGNRAQLSLSKKSKNIEKIRYKSSVSTLNDLLLAESKYLFAKAKLIESKYNYQKNRYYLDYLLERGELNED